MTYTAECLANLLVLSPFFIFLFGEKQSRMIFLFYRRLLLKKTNWPKGILNVDLVGLNKLSI